LRPPPALLPADGAGRGPAVPPEEAGRAGAPRSHRRRGGPRVPARGPDGRLPQGGPRPGALDADRPRVGLGPEPRGRDAGGAPRPASGRPLPPWHPPAPRGAALMAFVRRYRVSLVLLILLAVVVVLVIGGLGVQKDRA